MKRPKGKGGKPGNPETLAKSYSIKRRHHLNTQRQKPDVRRPIKNQNMPAAESARVITTWICSGVMSRLDGLGADEVYPWILAAKTKIQNAGEFRHWRKLPEKRNFFRSKASILAFRTGTILALKEQVNAMVNLAILLADILRQPAVITIN